MANVYNAPMAVSAASKLTAVMGGAANGNGMALYNGVMLPKLPDYDTAAYPYVGVAYLSFSGKYAISAFAERPYVTADGQYIASPVAQTYKSWYLSADGKSWDAQADVSTMQSSGMNLIAAFSALSYTWACFDLLNTDGTACLAGSDPISLDGMNVITWDGDTTGLLSVNLGVPYYRIADYVPAASGFCYVEAGTSGADDTIGEIFASEGPVWMISHNEVGPLCIAVPDEAKAELGFEQSGIYAFASVGLHTSLIAYKSASSGGVTETTATVNFSCADLLYTDPVYRIKAWCYPKGMDFWTAPATWESALFAGPAHSESVTFTGLLPGTEYEVYAVIYGTEGATEHNATLTFTTQGSAEGAVQTVILCNQVTGSGFTAWLFAQGLDSHTEYTAEFVVYRNDASGVFEKILTFTGSQNIQYCRFTGLLPETEYIASVYVYPTDGTEDAVFCECAVTTGVQSGPGGIFAGAENIARRVKAVYLGVNGVARPVKTVCLGVAGRAQPL